MCVRTSFARFISMLLLLSSAECVHAQMLDSCDVDQVISDQGECDFEDRSDGWVRLGFPPAGTGLLQSGNLVGEVTLTPSATNEIRIAQILPTQAAVWLSRQDTRATLIPDEWIDVVLVRQSTANTYVLSVKHWQSEGLSVTGRLLGTSASFTQAGALSLDLGWSFSQGQVTLNVGGPGSMTLALSRSGFGSTLPWLSLPHFPGGLADLGTSSIASLSGAAE